MKKDIYQKECFKPSLKTHSKLLLILLDFLCSSVDRIEERNGIIRIIDYKTGKVDQNTVTLKNWENLVTEIKNDKIIQILAYAFMFENYSNGLPMEVGIISFKNLKNGFLPFKFKQGKEETTLVDTEILENYLGELLVLLKEILNQEIPFEERVD